MFSQRLFLIERLKHIRKRFTDALMDAPADKFLYKGWTIKELISHVSGWDDVVIEALRAHAVSEPITPSVSRGIDTYNAHAVTSRESLDLEHAKRELETTRELLIQTFNDLPDEKFNQPLTFPWGETGTVAYLVEIFIEHEELHTYHLCKWKENPGETIENNGGIRTAYSLSHNYIG